MVRRASVLTLAASLVLALPACENGEISPLAGSAPTGSGGPLSVSIAASTTAGRAPLEVRFTSDVSGGDGALIYSWDFGDGTAASVPNPIRQFASGGTFLVTLRVSAGNGSATSGGINVRVESDVRLACFSDPGEGVAPVTIRFRAEPQGGTGDYTYLWTFGDGGSSTERAPVYTYQTPGIFTQGLTVTSGNSSASCVGPVYVYGNFQVGCRAVDLGASTIHFRALPNFCLNNICDYTWNFGDGTGLAGGPSAFRPDHVYPGPGLYTASVTARTGRFQDTCVLNVNVN